jgi:carbonic anhydrase
MTPRASRRLMMRMATAGVVASAVRQSRARSVRERPQSATPGPFRMPQTPEQAIRLLREGNERYRKQKLTAQGIDLAIVREHSEEQQEPFAAILCCADSRTPAEILFDQSIGHLFVVRVAGNIATPDTTGSLEYAASVLGVKTILVLGHSNCEAVKAAKAGDAVPGQISALFQYIFRAVSGTSKLDAAVKKNAQMQAATLRGASPVISQMVKKGKLSVEAAVYDYGTGKVVMAAH